MLNCGCNDKDNVVMIDVGFQGVNGAYSESAIYEYLCNNNGVYYPNINKDNINAIGYETFEDVFKYVVSNNMLGIIPIENTLGGTIHTNYDLLLRYSGSVYIIGELDYHVKHCLLTKNKDINIDNIKEAYSHPQALAQCSKYLRDKGIKPMVYNDTAGAAKMIASSSSSSRINTDIAAAISSSLAGDIYNLNIADNDIQDISFNRTRFLLIYYKPILNNISSIINKASIVFTMDDDTPGSLHKSLSVFTYRNLQLTKLESRPLPVEMLDDITNLETSNNDDKKDKGSGSYYNYLCYIDILINLGQDVAFTRAIDTLKEYNSFVRVLSIYPASANKHHHHHIAKPYAILQWPFDIAITSSSSPSSCCCINDINISFIGYGKFAQFLSDRLVKICDKRTSISATNIMDNNDDNNNRIKHAIENDIRYYSNFNIKDMLYNEKPDIIVVATSILSFGDVVNKLSYYIKDYINYTKKDILITDVCSVKKYPLDVMKEAFIKVSEVNTNNNNKKNDDDVDVVVDDDDSTTNGISILCTHPMFGPDSGKYGWYNLPLVYDDTYVDTTSDRINYITKYWLDMFNSCGCRLINMKADEHDKLSASTQFITHLTGRILSGIKPKLHKTDIDTVGFRSLIKLMDNTNNDSIELFKGLYRYNTSSELQLEAFENSLKYIKDILNKNGQDNVNNNNTNQPSPSTSSSADATDATDAAQLSKLIDRLPSSATVRLHAKSMELKRIGKDIQGALGVGEPDFLPSKCVIDGIEESLSNGWGCKYSPSNGIYELRKAIADDMNIRKGYSKVINADNVIITASGKSAIAGTFMAILDKNDEIIIPTPCWPTFPDLAYMCKAKPIFIETISPYYYITANMIESVITSKTKVILLNSPSNPTGHVIPLQELMAISKVLEKYPNIIAVCDDLYERLVYDGKQHHTLASICDNNDVNRRVITIGGFSKGYAMTGLRLGYAICNDITFIKAIGKVLGQITGCACTASQAGGLAALQNVPIKWYEERLMELQNKRNFIYKRLKNIPNVICPPTPPEGAFYIMPDIGYYVNKMRINRKDETIGISELCEELLSSQGLSIVPGTGFYSQQPVVRLSYATSIENIDDACNRLEKFLSSL